MKKEIMNKEAIVEALANTDPVYQHMMNEASKLEKRFDKMVAKLSDDQRDIAWDFVMKCEDISQRKLYLACRYMEFKGIADSDIAFSDDYEERKRQADILAKAMK